VVPTPAGPGPQDPHDPEGWDWGQGEIPFAANGGPDDHLLRDQLARRRRRQRLVALVVVVLFVLFVLATTR
jgi:hypothetical protein